MSDSGSSRTGGRPSKPDQVKMEIELFDCFKRGLSATAASSETNRNIKTVCEYFGRWADEIIKTQQEYFMEQQKLDRAQIILSFDTQLIEGYKFLDEIKEQIKHAKEIDKIPPKHLMSLQIETLKFISSILEKKGSFIMSPVIDQALKEKITEMARNGKN